MVDFYIEIQQLSNSYFKYLNYWSTKMLIFKVFVICLKFKKFIIKNTFFFIKTIILSEIKFLDCEMVNATSYRYICYYDIFGCFYPDFVVI